MKKNGAPRQGTASGVEPSLRIYLSKWQYPYHFKISPKCPKALDQACHGNPTDLMPYHFSQTRAPFVSRSCRLPIALIYPRHHHRMSVVSGTKKQRGETCSSGLSGTEWGVTSLLYPSDNPALAPQVLSLAVDSTHCLHYSAKILFVDKQEGRRKKRINCEVRHGAFPFSLQPRSHRIWRTSSCSLQHAQSDWLSYGEKTPRTLYSMSHE